MMQNSRISSQSVMVESPTGHHSSRHSTEAQVPNRRSEAQGGQVALDRVAREFLLNLILKFPLNQAWIKGIGGGGNQGFTSFYGKVFYSIA